MIGSFVKKMSGQCWLLLAVLVLGTSCRFFLFYDHSIWDWITAGTANDAYTAWSLNMIGFYAAFIVGALLAGKFNAKRIAIAGMAASLFLLILMKLFPLLQGLYIGYALLGIVTGAYYAAFAYMGIVGISREIRVQAVALFALGFNGIIQALKYLSIGLDHNVVFGILSGMLALALALSLRLKLPVPVPRTGKQRPFPLKLLAIYGFFLVACYFTAYLTKSGMSANVFSFEEQGLSWLTVLVRLSVYAVFIIIGARVGIFSVFYAGVICLALAYLVSVLNVVMNPVACLLYQAGGALAQVFVFSTTTEIGSRYPRKTWIFGLLVLCGGTGVVAGHFFGRLWYFSGLDPVVVYAVPGIIYCALLLAVPLLFKAIREETDLEHNGTLADFSAFKGIPKVTVTHENLLIQLGRINGTFDEEYRLTLREQEIASHLAERLDYETISNQLSISINTLKVHIRNIYRKYDLRGRKDLIELVRKQGFGQAVG